MTDDKGAGVKEQMYSDVMTETQISRMSGYSDGYNAGRKAERERCAQIAELNYAEHHDGEEAFLCGEGKIIAEKIRGGQDGE